MTDSHCFQLVPDIRIIDQVFTLVFAVDTVASHVFPAISIFLPLSTEIFSILLIGRVTDLDSGMSQVNIWLGTMSFSEFGGWNHRPRTRRIPHHGSM